MTAPVPTIGMTFEFAHPFVRDVYQDFDEGGPFEQKTWRPGTRAENVPPDDAEMVADGVGAQIVAVVSIHKPGRFPTRIFFTRRWRDPAGREFGKGKLHTKTLGAFRTLVRGYRHEFRLIEAQQAAA